MQPDCKTRAKNLFHTRNVLQSQRQHDERGDVEQRQPPLDPVQRGRKEGHNGLGVLLRCARERLQARMTPNMPCREAR